MIKTKTLRLGLAVAMLFICTAALASPIVLTFEGLGDLEPINDFYNGGTGGFGSSGTNYGISFTSDSLAIISGAAGGSGNFSGNPSGSTIAFFLTGAGDTMNVAAGFDTGFSFFYSSSTAGSVTVWSGLNGTGTLLGSVFLTANFSNSPCGPYGAFCHWDPSGVSFSGTAMSAIFSGTANQVGFDDITLGSATPGTVPEPASLLLLGTGVVGGIRVIRKRLKL